MGSFMEADRLRLPPLFFTALRTAHYRRLPSSCLGTSKRLCIQKEGVVPWPETRIFAAMTASTHLHLSFGTLRYPLPSRKSLLAISAKVRFGCARTRCHMSALGTSRNRFYL